MRANKISSSHPKERFIAVATDIIYGERVTQGVDAESKAGALWLTASDLERVSGWVHKPEGFCRGEVCVPAPHARKNEFAAGGRFNLAALAGLLGQPSVADETHHVWCIGEAAAERKRALTSLDAPDFTLPDLDGKMHSLSQYRGKKVFVASWASW
jgi:AhpC/TSA family